MFSQLMEALQAATLQMAAPIDCIANFETQRPSAPVMDDTLNIIVQRLDYLEQENQLMRKAMKINSSAPAEIQ